MSKTSKADIRKAMEELTDMIAHVIADFKGRSDIGAEELRHAAAAMREALTVAEQCRPAPRGKRTAGTKSAPIARIQLPDRMEKGA